MFAQILSRHWWMMVVRGVICEFIELAVRLRGFASRSVTAG
jgi:hypothetical protein